MKKQKNLLIAFLLLLTMTFVSCGYNQMQAKEEEVFEAWSNVESNLQRRSDLIPNLVSTVKGAAAHEANTLTAVVEARAKATSTTITTDDLSNPEAMSQFNAAQSGLSSALSKLMVVIEKYPDLKANENFLSLQSQLEGTENRINVARDRYNKKVKDFNTFIRQFPYSLTNSWFLHLEKKEYFKADSSAKENPKVEF